MFSHLSLSLSLSLSSSLTHTHTLSLSHTHTHPLSLSLSLPPWTRCELDLRWPTSSSASSTTKRWKLGRKKPRVSVWVHTERWDLLRGNVLHLWVYSVMTLVHSTLSFLVLLYVSVHIFVLSPTLQWFSQSCYNLRPTRHLGLRGSILGKIFLLKMAETPIILRLVSQLCTKNRPKRSTCVLGAQSLR